MRDDGSSGRGSNSVGIRRFNQQLILATLRRAGDISRADLARRTTLTHNAVGLIVDDLVAQGLVQEVGRLQGARGQPATLLGLVPDGMMSIGLKMGRASTIGVLVDFGGVVLRRLVRERALPGPTDALDEARSVVDELMAAIPATARDRLAGVGLAIPYDLASWRRELDLPGDHLAAWQGFDFVAALSERLDMAILSENDGTAVAIAELFCGHGRELDDFVSLHIASAIGGGIVIGGQPRFGHRHNAGDIGLMPASRVASAPGGSFEILLARASVRSLIRHFREHGLSVATRAEIDAAMAANDDLVARWLEDSAKALVEPLLSIGVVLDVEAVVVDGDLDAALVGKLVKRLRSLATSAAPEARKPPVVLQGTLGRDAAAIGAAILPLHALFTPDRRLLLGSAA